MGLFGPSIEKENRHGVIKFYIKCRRGKCRGGKIYGDTEKECKNNWKEHDKVHDNHAKQGAREIKKLQERNARENKGKCASCGYSPCRMSKPDCVKKAAKGLRSTMSFDPSNPGEFDEQLKWWNENMR